ncbi:hypothetical protein CLIB1444_23S00386 [[Candida] jaroonii]|uniref:Uncharacterized protein n=1 Tax=[Candida] jaroonii TaxID=467808 RepID=A0ACA9YGG9_9ASCO|nr:hypothetical protein CLIB1444_23S00386 [[Candida] jaroonii]
MSFKGTLLEFPQIAIDRFNVSAQLYLLTHFHKDHLIGLANQSFHGSVICSHATKDLARLDPQLRHKITHFRALPFNIAHKYTVGDTEVEIVLIPAYHCPGSTMYLVKSVTTAVLFTGDLRAERWWVQALPKNIHLLPYITGLDVLDTIYLDTTFAYRGEPYIEIPHNHDGVALVVSLLRKFPQDMDVEVYFRDHVSGFDEAWSQIVGSVGGGVHFDDAMFRRHQVVDGHSTYAPVDREGATATPRFHVCNPRTCPSRAKFKINVRQAINFNIVDLASSLMPLDLRRIDPQELSTMVTEDVTVGGHEIVRFRQRTWLKVGTELLPREIKLIFSRHSSYTECKEFVGMFRPRQVVPLTESHHTWCQGFLMSRVFGDVCRGKRVEDFVYDLTNATTKGVPPKKVLARKVATVDRWSVEGCRAEVKFVDRMVSGLGPLGPLPILSTATRDLGEDPSTPSVVRPTSSVVGPTSSVVRSTPSMTHSGPNITQSLDPVYVQEILQHTEAVYKKYINSKIPGHRIAFDMSFDSDRSSDRSSDPVSDRSRDSLPSSGPAHVTEFGTAHRLPTVEGIASSFSSECSHYLANNNVDEVGIARICRKLRRRREEYFSLRLECLQ